MGKLKRALRARKDVKKQVDLAKGVSTALMAGLRGEESRLDLGDGVKIHAYQVSGNHGMMPTLRIDLVGLVELAEENVIGGGTHGIGEG